MVHHQTTWAIYTTPQKNNTVQQTSQVLSPGAPGAQGVLDPSIFGGPLSHVMPLRQNGDGALKFCGFQCSNAMQPAIR